VNKERILIGMSGGVDSSVAAMLLKQAGHDCIGVTMKLWQNEPDADHVSRTCCTLDDAADARSVAARLGMRHYVFNFKEDFRREVTDRFVREYEAGRTPNPCIDCNRFLKFGTLLHRAQELGCDAVATGHYARIQYENGRYLLMKAADVSKDQTYFLACLSQEQLAHTRFPLGGLTKAEVRELAAAGGLVTAAKHDSQDICFVPDGDYAAFLRRYTGKSYPAGDYLDLQGNVVGRHSGTVNYTIGQRKGLGIAMGEPVYVCAKDMTADTVTIGPNEALFSSALEADSWSWFPFPELTGALDVTARIRHSRTEYPARVLPLESGAARVEFREPVRAVSPGQAVVLYQGDVVVGGGTITKAL